MKVIKRGQLAMLSISFMIMIAGYLNYKYDPKREENLGQTVKVDSNYIYLNTSDKNVDIYNDEKAMNKNTNLYNNKSGTLSTYKNSRDNMISELETNLNTAISVSTTTEEKNEYQKKIDELIKNKHMLEIVEGMLKAKGIEDLVIVPNDDKISVFVKSNKKLDEAQVTMIEQIIKEEFNVKIENIKIIEE